jgi:transposase
MGRHKGSTGPQRKWTIEEKMKIIRKHLNEHVGFRSLEKEFEVNRGQIHAWITKYLNQGESGLETSREQRNPMTHLNLKKNLTLEEQLTLENFKLKIEVERLKKGYQVKGVGRQKEYVPLSKKNIKSSKP